VPVDNVPILALLHKFILPEAARDPRLVSSQAERWTNYVGPTFVAGLGNKKFFEGEQFTGVDIICGFTLNLANRNGWLEAGAAKPLKEYVERINTRANFLRAIIDPNK